MNARAILIALLLGTAPLAAAAQGFAGLGDPAEFAQPDPARGMDFPADHGAHPEFRIEWWYLTANLTGEDGQAYGVQWTLFRNAAFPSGAATDQLWMGHAALSAPGRHHVAERLARGGTGQAGVTATPFAARIDEWAMEGADADHLTITAQGTDFAFDLTVKATGPLVLHGDNGVSVKSAAGQASHYYSQPFYEVDGTLALPSGEVKVSGLGWLDREWSSGGLLGEGAGWDWVSLHFDGGDKLMAYRFRDPAAPVNVTGTWIGRDGTAAALRPGEIVMEPGPTVRVAGRDMPMTWHLSVPSRGIEVEVAALRPDSWMPTIVPYWEGPVRVSGSRSGTGYLEMTGYE